MTMSQAVIEMKVMDKLIGIILKYFFITFFPTIVGHFPIEEFEDLMADLEKQNNNNDLDYEYLNTNDAANFLDEYNDYMPAIINTESLNNNLVNIQLSSKHEIKWERLPFSNSNKPILNDILPDVSDYYEIQAPLVYFNRYFNDAEIEKMVEMTNRYAIQNGSSWNKPTDIWEIKTFIALHIRMGCLKYPRVRMYWDTTLGLSNFSQYMTVNRFFSLRTNFHVVDNLTLSNDNKDRFKKVRPMYDCVRKRCKQLIVERNISIDEQIVPFTGKLNIKQYCKGKPNPWGVKIYVMCGSSGTIYDFLLYQGSATEFDIPPQIQKQVGMGGSVVLTLTQDLEKNKHCLYFDNFFAGYNLFEILLHKKIYAASTIRVNRFSKPPFLNDKWMASKGRGTTDEIRNKEDTICLVKWYDNKPVYMCSNFIASGEVEKVKRWDKKTKQYLDIEQPEVIKMYNKSMGGVDKIDQLIAYYRIFIKSKKWTLRMMFHAIDMACCNSWLEYLKDCDKFKIKKKDRMDLLNFKLRLADNLINLGSSAVTKSRGRPSSSTPKNSPQTKKKKKEPLPHEETRKDLIGHLPMYNNNKLRCKKEGCGAKTHVYCKKCNVHLCFVVHKKNCFTDYHL